MKDLPSKEILSISDWVMEANDGAHDPVLAYADGTWYMFYTSYNLRFKSSEDGKNWTDEGSVFKRRPKWAQDYLDFTPSVNIWAPDIFYFRGSWYLSYSVSSFGKNSSVIGLVSNQTLNPADENYEWIDLGPIFWSEKEDNFNAIDSDIFLENGTPWLVFGSWWSGIKMTELDRETLKPLDSDNLVELASRPGIDAVEGATIFTHGNFYYLLLSFDHCCQGILSDYKLMVGRSRKLQGPYLDRNGTPLLEGGGTLLLEGGERWKGPGHGDVFQSPRGDLLIFHSYDAERNGEAYLRIGALEWDEENWPYVKMELDH